MPDETEPTEAALLAAYSAAAQMHTNEGQLIWQRVGNFLLFNGVLFGALAAVIEFGYGMDAVWAAVIIGAVGFYFCVFHMLSMARAWRYHDAYLVVMKRQEKMLGLGRFGPITELPYILALRPRGLLGHLLFRVFGPLNARNTEALTAFFAAVGYVGVATWVSANWRMFVP